MCWPRFDSSFIFGDLLDKEQGGHFYIHPENGAYDTAQTYLPNTSIVETVFENETYAFKVTDFAPRFYQYERYFKPLMLVRKVTPLKGAPHIRVCCHPVGDYGKRQASLSMGSNHIAYRGLEDEVRLTTNIPVNFVAHERPFVLNEPKYLVLTFGEPLEAPLQTTAEDFLKKTHTYWTTWVKNTNLEPFAQQEVIRSAITLKLHQYEDTGAIIASSTTSLPESPGSGRTWDYRYCWLRDAHYTLRALNDLSHFSELEHYAEFIENIALTEEGRYHPLYPITLKEHLAEQQLDLLGYQGNQPVRIGNQAWEHVQNDAYGQVLVTLLPFFTDARLKHGSRRFMQKLVMKILRSMEDRLEEPDNGLWEFRETRQHHCYTYLFHWAGGKAACKIAHHIADEEMDERANKIISKAEAYIEQCNEAGRAV
jgi:GH15 family glucan-1,4-alpha-glucosidase